MQQDRSVCFAEYGTPGTPYDAQRLKTDGLQAGDFVRGTNKNIPWEGNPVSLAGRIRMARTQHFKLVEEIGGTDELYDLAHDPYELTNLAGHPAYADTERSLRQQLLTENQSSWLRRLTIFTSFAT